MCQLFCWTARKMENGKLGETRYFESKKDRDLFVNEHPEWCKRGKICRENLEKHQKEEPLRMIEIWILREHSDMVERAAEWFHQKWGVPLEAYQESIQACLRENSIIPQWYIAVSNNTIIGGLGVIKNDFHNRQDLAPNVCAVYVEEDYRCQGIAEALLQAVCDDMKKQGIDTLYLVTDHTSFYERYDWKFLCMVQGDDGLETRMYVHKY